MYRLLWLFKPVQASRRDDLTTKVTCSPEGEEAWFKVEEERGIIASGIDTEADLRQKRLTDAYQRDRLPHVPNLAEVKGAAAVENPLVIESIVDIAVGDQRIDRSLQ